MDDPCYQLLDSYPEILTPSFTIQEPKHGVRHYIPTDGPPVQSKPRRLDGEKLAVAKKELEKLVDLGIAYRGRRKGTIFPFQFSPLIPFPLVLVLRELESRVRPAILKRRKIEEVRDSSPSILRKRTFFSENLKATQLNPCLYALNDRC